MQQALVLRAYIVGVNFVSAYGKFQQTHCNTMYWKEQVCGKVQAFQSKPGNPGAEGRAYQVIAHRQTVDWISLDCRLLVYYQCGGQARVSDVLGTALKG